MADRFQISMMTPSKGRDYVTISISIFVKCGKCRVFTNPVTYKPAYNRLCKSCGTIDYECDI